MNFQKTHKLLLFLALFIASLSSTAQSVDNQAEFNANEYLIKADGNITFLLDKYDIEIVRKLRTSNNIYLVKKRNTELNSLAKTSSQRNNVLLAVEQMKQESTFELVQPNYIYTAVGNAPNDKFFSKQWGLHNDGTYGTVGADIDAIQAWDVHDGDGKTVVAIIDSGVDYKHIDLVENIYTNENEIPDNGIDDDNNGFIDDVHGWDFGNNDNDPMDVYGHGTHVAGIVGAVGNNEIGVIGVNPHVKIIPLKFLNDNGRGSSAGAIEALNYAVMMNIPISCNSYGNSSFDLAFYDAIENAQNNGHLFIAAAGNDYGTNNDIIAHFPSNYNLPNVISVASTDEKDNLSAFSNIGVETVHIAAPGSSVFNLAPGDNYVSKNGTSMAAPMVVGAASLIKSYNKALTYSEIKNILLSTVDVLPSLDGKIITSGRLNVYKALLATDDSPFSAYPNNADFGEVGIGDRLTKSIKLYNNSDSERNVILDINESAFETNITRLIINPNSYAIVEVTFTPKEDIQYSAIMNCKGGDANVKVALTASGIKLPKMFLSDDVLSYSLGTNSSTSNKLTIDNNGDGDLDWELTGLFPRSAGKKKSVIVSDSDEYGYSFIDSDSPNGPVFDWIDLTDKGENIHGLLRFGTSVGPFPIGFEFTFYGKVYNEFYITSNGLIAFGETQDNLPSAAYTPIPNSSYPNNMIAWNWNNLNPETGETKYYFDGEKLIFEMTHISDQNSYGFLDGQVIIYKDGRIKLQYRNLKNYVDVINTVVGIENESGKDGLEVMLNKEYLHEDLAIMISRNDWLEASVTKGVIPPNQSIDIDLTAYSTDKKPGNYINNITLTSNDPRYKTQEILTKLSIAPQDITFSVNMSVYEKNGSFNSNAGDLVLVRGAFNGWSDNDFHQLSSIGNGIYEATFPIFSTSGSKESYKFFIKPGLSKKLPNDGWEESVGTNQNGPTENNREFAATGGTQVLNTVYFNNNSKGLPLIFVDPEKFIVTVDQGESTSEVLTINNFGNNKLNYNLSQKLEGVSVETYTLSIPKYKQKEGDVNEVDLTQLSLLDKREKPLSVELADLTGVRVLFEASHGNKPIDAWSILIADLERRGAQVIANEENITNKTLENIDILWLTSPGMNFEKNEQIIIRTWLNNGGAIFNEVFLWYSMDVYNELYEGLNSGIGFAPYYAQQGLTDNFYEHPITKDVKSAYLPTDSYTYLALVKTPATPIYEGPTGWPNAAVTTVGTGKMVFCTHWGFTDYYINYEDNEVLANQTFDWLASKNNSWLNFDKPSGNIDSYSEEKVTIKADSKNLFGGTYKVDLILESNDPNNSSIEIPFELRVVGEPKVDIAAELNFGDSYISKPNYSKIVISNIGSEVLEITDLEIKSLYFRVVSDKDFKLKSGESKYIEVKFLPYKEGEYTSSMRIVSNTTDANVIIKGNAILSPEIKSDESRFSAKLESGEKISKNFSLSNPGRGPLNWKFKEVANGIPSKNSYGDDKRIEILSWVPYLSPNNDNYVNLVNHIKKSYPNSNITDTRVIDSVLLRNELKGKDVFLIPPSIGGTAQFFDRVGEYWTDVLYEFTAGGGTVMCVGSNFSNHYSNLLNGSGLLKHEYGGMVISADLTINNNHFLTSELEDKTHIELSLFNYIISDDPDIEELVYAYHGDDMAFVSAAKNLGSGRVIFLGYMFTDPDIVPETIVSNGLIWKTKKWFKASKNNGTLGIKVNEKMTIDFDATGLDTGIYKGELWMYNTDADETKTVIPITLTVGDVLSEGEFETVNSSFSLQQNIPNPSIKQTEITFNIPENADVKLTVYNLLGQKVVEVVNAKFKAGKHTVVIDTRTIEAGVYIYRLEANNFSSTKKMQVIK